MTDNPVPDWLQIGGAALAAFGTIATAAGVLISMFGDAEGARFKRDRPVACGRAQQLGRISNPSKIHPPGNFDVADEDLPPSRPRGSLAALARPEPV